MFDYASLIKMFTVPQWFGIIMMAIGGTILFFAHFIIAWFDNEYAKHDESLYATFYMLKRFWFVYLIIVIGGILLLNPLRIW